MTVHTSSSNSEHWKKGWTGPTVRCLNDTSLSVMESAADLPLNLILTVTLVCPGTQTTWIPVHLWLNPGIANKWHINHDKQDEYTPCHGMVCLNRSEHEETKSNQARSGMSSPEIGKPVWDSENILFYLYLVPEHTVWCCMIHTDHTDNRLVLEGNNCTVACKSVILGEDCSSCTICPTLLQQHYCLSHTAATALPVPSVPHCSNSTIICPTLQQQLCHLSHIAATALLSVPHCSNSTTICPTLQQQHYHLSHTAATALPSVPHYSNSTAGTLLCRMTYRYYNILYMSDQCAVQR